MIVCPLRRAGLGLLAVIAISAAGPCLAASFYDFAQVLECTPVVERERVPVRRASCVEQEARPPAELAGWMHERDPGLSLSEWIRTDAERRAASAQTCSERVDFEVRERVVAFDVRYLYGGAEYLRRMDHDPGRRLRVRVEMETR